MARPLRRPASRLPRAHRAEPPTLPTVVAGAGIWWPLRRPRTQRSRGQHSPVTLSAGIWRLLRRP
eukprot:3307763-Amphidinium_carterae.1